ncbi:MAG TPA: cytochrome P460 family protein [Methylomirabilota bacterium]|nr:cytochrome P460 family protein [Methylomirabilota bacterium]
MTWSHLSRFRTFVLVAGLTASAVGLYAGLGRLHPSRAAAETRYHAQFTATGELVRPEGWREWVYIGAPLTPNSLNPPAAPFPEFHNVYIDPESWKHYQRTGAFREGTLLAKELVSVGATQATSGKGFFMGEMIGFEIAYKSAARFPNEPGHWAYFSFGHKPEPYDQTAAKQPVANCAACHTVAAAQDNVFTQYYPVLRAARPK